MAAKFVEEPDESDYSESDSECKCNPYKFFTWRECDFCKKCRCESEVCETLRQTHCPECKCERCVCVVCGSEAGLRFLPKNAEEDKEKCEKCKECKRFACRNCCAGHELSCSIWLKVD